MNIPLPGTVSSCSFSSPGFAAFLPCAVWFEALELHQGRGLVTALTDDATTGHAAIPGTNSSSKNRLELDERLGDVMALRLL